MAVAFIPARGGSKGIPRKNLQDLCGHPLVAWSIIQARQSRSIDRVVVSSDCDEILSVARRYGADTLRRPAELSGDEASTETAIAHWLKLCKTTPEIAVMLQPTSPLRQPGDIDGAVETLKQNGADSVFSACRIEGFTWTVNGHVAANYDYDQRQRRQDLRQHTIEENGSIYVFRPRAFFRQGNRLCGRIAWYEMHPLDSYQVDEPGDLDMMRQLMPMRCPAMADAA